MQSNEMRGQVPCGSWPARVRDIEVFEPADLDTVPWERIREVAVVCQPEPGLVTLGRLNGRWSCPSGECRSDEDPWDDTVHRITLDTMAFRRQGTHAFALDPARRHVAFWVEGGPYSGLRPHARDAETTTLPTADAVALLVAQGDSALARLVASADTDRRSMTYERHRRDLQRTLTGTYLRATTPAGGSGFGGTEDDWRDARSGLATALIGLPEQLGRPERPVTFLDVGCANGHLGASFVTWGAEHGVAVEPYGVDLAPELVVRARELHPQWHDRFWVGDALDWQHPAGTRFDLVHVLLDGLPYERHGTAIANLLRSTTPGGRLLVSAYDTRPERSAEAIANRLGLKVAGRTPVRARRQNGKPFGTPSVWVTRQP